MKKNIIITGTSRGIGFELVKLFAEEGHEVLALSRNAEPTQQLDLPNVTSFSFDITNTDSHREIADYVAKKLKTVDILIHNAGKFLKNRFEKISLEELTAVYQTNVFGVFGLTQQLLPYLKKESHVVAISSMGGIQGSVKFPELTAYSSSKAAVINLMEVLAEERQGKGPIFNALALGSVQTEMFNDAFPGGEAALQPLEIAEYIKQFALTGQRIYNGKVLPVSNSTP